MVIVWGSRLYGHVDHIVGLNVYVATKFGHLWYFPIIPERSYLVISQNKNGWRGIPIPMNGKSILTAWLRACTCVAGIFSAVITLAMAVDSRHTEWFWPLLVCISAWGLFLVSMTFRGLRYATYKRALVHCQNLNLTAEGWAMIEAAYKQEGRGFPVQPTSMPMGLDVTNASINQTDPVPTRAH